MSSCGWGAWRDEPDVCSFVRKGETGSVTSLCTILMALQPVQILGDLIILGVVPGTVVSV